MKKKILITGGLGFIGSNLITLLDSLKMKDFEFYVIDKTSHNQAHHSLRKIFRNNPNFFFKKINICNFLMIQSLFKSNKFDGVINLAAETHVDKSIIDPLLFSQTNIIGTLNLLNESVRNADIKKFRFLQVSTDEVYGSLGINENPFTENSPISPNNPYSASKASADCLINSFEKTFGLNSIITRSSNNYGPFQTTDKLIPLLINRCIKEMILPIYGNGENIRDWIYVKDHVEGLWKIFLEGKTGKVYHFGGNSEHSNFSIARMICENFHTNLDSIKFVKDRPGHDFRYSMNYSKTTQDISWHPTTPFRRGLDLTIKWYKQEYFNQLDKNKMGNSFQLSKI